MQSSFVPIGLSSVTDDYFRGKFKIIQHEIVSTNSDSNPLKFYLIGFLVMAFDNDGEPIGRFSDEGDFRFMDCSNGTNVYVNVNVCICVIYFFVENF
jgi:hypothetical protein